VNERSLEWPSRSVHVFMLFSSGISCTRPCRIDVSASTPYSRSSYSLLASSADARDHWDCKLGRVCQRRHSGKHLHDCLLLPKVYRYGPRIPIARRRIRRTPIPRSCQRVLSIVVAEPCCRRHFAPKAQVEKSLLARRMPASAGSQLALRRARESRARSRPWQAG
jgi:hypothetical protein